MSKENATSETQATEFDTLKAEGAQTGCCGGAAPKGTDACCALDAELQASGGSGCGCTQKSASGSKRKGGCC